MVQTDYVKAKSSAQEAEKAQSIIAASPWLFEEELATLHPVSGSTRRRQEAEGKFPRRIHLGTKVIAWRRTDVEAWIADPEGWAAAHKLKAEAA